jgi:CheY-like chemotaxis protein
MPNILVVDDSRTFVSEAIEFFQWRGWPAEGAFDGDQAIAMLAKQRFDAVVLDRNMPGKSGDQVLRWVRSKSQFRDTCIIVLTGYGNVESAVEALKLGAFQYLQKPQELNQLLSVLAAGVFWHKALSMRAGLLGSADQSELFSRVGALFAETLQGDRSAGVFFSKDGDVVDVLTGLHSVSGAQDRAYLNRILAGEQLIFEQEGAKVGPLQPILDTTRTLMAVPVPGTKGETVGVLSLESPVDGAFDTCWRDVLTYLADLIGIGLLRYTAHSASASDQSGTIRLPLRAFLCHSSSDRAQVKLLYDRLRSENCDPWLDKEDLLPGQDWELEIRRAVRASDVVIVCLSARSVSKAGFVQNEIKYALDIADGQPEGSIFLIPLRLEDCRVPERLGRYQWVDLYKTNGHEMLMRALHARAEALGKSAGS